MSFTTKQRTRATTAAIPDDFELEIRCDLHRDVLEGIVRFITGLPCISSATFSGRSLQFTFKQFHGNGEKRETLDRIEKYLKNLGANARHIVR